MWGAGPVHTGESGAQPWVWLCAGEKGWDSRDRSPRALGKNWRRRGQGNGVQACAQMLVMVIEETWVFLAALGVLAPLAQLWFSHCGCFPAPCYSWGVMGPWGMRLFPPVGQLSCNPSNVCGQQEWCQDCRAPCCLLLGPLESRKSQTLHTEFSRADVSGRTPDRRCPALIDAWIFWGLFGIASWWMLYQGHCLIVTLIVI